MKQGLGTQLRHLIELLDGAVARSYEVAELPYRPRYTPIFKALITLEECTVSQLAEKSGITQPAATQTVQMMLKDELIEIRKSEIDSRQRLISLSPLGKKIVPMVQQCWDATNTAAINLEKDVGVPLSQVLDRTIKALKSKSFDARIQKARKSLGSSKSKSK